MSEIIIIEKPENVSYDTIRDIIRRAHQVLIERGIVMRVTTFSSSEIETRVGDKGKCFIALDGEQIVGTASCKIDRWRSWCYHGEAMKLMFLGIIPSYTGKNVFSKLMQAVENEAMMNDKIPVFFDTAENNFHMQKICALRDYKHVNFVAFPFSDHYSVEMMKWLDDCPYTKGYFKLRYSFKKFYTKLRFKPRRIKRFSI